MTTDSDEDPLVRPYAITGGRTPDVHRHLDRATQVTTVAATRASAAPGVMTPEHVLIVHSCSRSVSIAELAASLRQPLGVIQVLVGDLLDYGVVSTRSPSVDDVSDEVLKKVLDGLAKL